MARSGHRKRWLIFTALIVVLAIAEVLVGWTVSLQEPSRLDNFASSFPAVKQEGKLNAAAEEPAEHQSRTDQLPQLSTADQDKDSTSEPQGCFPFNSREWLEERRFGNAADPLMNDDYVRQMIIGPSKLLLDPKFVLQQTLADEKSRFSNTFDLVDQSDENVRLWAVRLIYLVIHYHQHAPALKEAQHRLEISSEVCSTEMEKLQIGKFDFECPHVKYLTVSLMGNGIGANLRTHIFGTLIAGLETGRIVHFINGASDLTGIMARPWPQASCDRKDYQCVFAPTSPCVPTMKDLDNVYQLTPAEKAVLYQQGKLPEGHEGDKVIYIVSIHKGGMNSGTVEPVIHDIAQEMVNQLPLLDVRKPLLQKAVDLILKRDKPREGFDFYEATSKTLHALTFYGLRPNLSAMQQLVRVVNENLPQDFLSDHSIGLPIRASDKCRGESECLTFDQHMDATIKAWNNYEKKIKSSGKAPFIIFTTESKQMVRDQKVFMNQTLPNQPSPKYRFVTNGYDVIPDSGHGARRPAINATADQVMLSAVSSLKLQLMARLTIGNCCSGFHITMHSFLREGLGAASSSSFECLQENENLEYQLCCHKNRICQEKRDAEIRRMATHVLRA